MSDTKLIIKKTEKTFEDKENKKWKVLVKEDRTINFGEKPEKGKTKSTDKLKVFYKKDEKDATESEADLELTYNSGWFFKDAKLPKTISSELELKEAKKLDVKGFQPGFWVAFGVSAFVIGLLGYWWFSSSRKEEKEEDL